MGEVDVGRGRAKISSRAKIRLNLPLNHLFFRLSTLLLYKTLYSAKLFMFMLIKLFLYCKKNLINSINIKRFSKFIRSSMIVKPRV